MEAKFDKRAGGSIPAREEDNPKLEREPEEAAANSAGLYNMGLK